MNACPAPTSSDAGLRGIERSAPPIVSPHSGGAKPKGKKRVRRIQLELPTQISEKRIDQNRVAVLWDDIAERQLKERLREEHTSGLGLDFYSYRKLQQREQDESPNRTIHFRWDLSLGQEVVKPDPSAKVGIIFEARSGTVLPFKLEVVIEASWKFLGHGEGQQCIVPNSDQQANTLVRSFSIETDFEGFFSEVVGKYTCRKHVMDDEVVIVWVECADVLEFAGAKFDGMQYMKRGYLKLKRILREGPGEQSTSTVPETYSKTTPVLREGATDPALQMQELVWAVKRSHNKVNKVFCETLSGLLLEEDWRATVGQDEVNVA
ncbi:hypothetical protein ON010_g12432 [Phytophthora cinnamomi]|nr:hypothetical protein ON010_g12432 [Phytophthora cinnamomi]